MGRSSAFAVMSCLGFLLSLSFPAAIFAQSVACPTGNGVNTKVSKDSSGSFWQVSVTGCPNYSPYGQTTGNPVYAQNQNFQFPVQPVLSTTPVYVSIYTDAQGTKNPTGGVKGDIGVAVNGASIYGDADALSRDAYVYEGRSFDSCRGHSDQRGLYHYHTVPSDGCVFSDVAGRHSPFWGLMADGIPIAGDLGDSGVAPTDLDECGGHVDSTYPFYHYHSTGLKNPYTVRCLRGCIKSTSFRTLSTYTSSCSPASTQYDYSSLMTTYFSWTAGSWNGSGSTGGNTNTGGFGGNLPPMNGQQGGFGGNLPPMNGQQGGFGGQQQQGQQGGPGGQQGPGGQGSLGRRALNV